MFKLLHTIPTICLFVFMSTNATIYANATNTTSPKDINEINNTSVRVVKSNSQETTFSPLTLDYYTKNNTVQALNKVAKSQVSNQAVTNDSQASVFQEARKYTFIDVPTDYWAATSIAVMTNQKLISGYSDNTFRPDKPITREEVASLFSRLISDESLVMLASSFKDITSDRWSANAIERVAQLNIISGYGDKTYRPERFMSRQEFAVVADNYIHYLGYTTEDPSKLSLIHYSDQKFIAPWAQAAVCELAQLGFLHYESRLLFNPEKYITRAEATEIMYRITNSSSAVVLREKILHQDIENKILALITRTFGDEYIFRTHGAMFWQNNKLVVTLKAKNDVKKLSAALALTTDKNLVNTVLITSGNLTEIELSNLETEVTYFYTQQEPHGSIITIGPNKNISGLVMIVDKLTESTKKAFAKKFGHKVEITLPTNN